MFDELRQAVLTAVALHAGAAVIALELKDWEGWGQLDRDERQMPEWSKWLSTPLSGAAPARRDN